jgi:GDP-L-fucose synthase
MAKTRIFLTGGRGMVGQNILEHPAAAQYDIVAPSSQELNLTDLAATQRFMTDTNPDVVIHSAGRVGGIQANIAHPVDFLVTNMDLGRNVIMAARKAGVPKLINLASSCMYPRNAPNPLSETLILQGELEPTNEGYALAKIFTTRLCEYINRESQQTGEPGVRYKTLIPCNLYGRHDKFAPQHSHLIPAIIHKVHVAKVQNLPEVEIWGDGTARREFMYAGDLADMLFRAIKEFNSLPELMNVGLGQDQTINEYYAAVADVLGYTGNFHHDLSKPEGIARKLVSIERQQELGWHGKTSLREGINFAYQFYLQNKPQLSACQNKQS